MRATVTPRLSVPVLGSAFRVTGVMAWPVSWGVSGMPCHVDLLRAKPVASPSVPRGHLSHLVVLMVPESGSGGPAAAGEQHT